MEIEGQVKLIQLVQADSSVPSNTVVVPDGFLPEIKYNTVYKMRFGLKETNIVFYPASSKRTCLFKISKDVFETFNLYDNMEVYVRIQGDKLRLSPMMGVFMNEHAVRRLHKENPTVKMLEMANAAKNAGVIVYFFTIGDVLWSENMINAVVYKHETDTWERREMPLPDVLYDRGGGFSPESLEKARKLRRQLDTIPNLFKLNAQHYFDKWDLHCKLSKDREMRAYLPETISFDNNIAEFRRMLDKHKTVYLKMRTGSNGQGVIRVRKTKGYQYEYSYFKEKVVQGIARSYSELVRIAEELMNDRSFIIQQGIDVITHEENKVDMRVLVQRDSNGEWQITSIPVRIAVNDCAVTSTKSGSKVYPFGFAFTNILYYTPEMTESILAGIKKMIDTAVRTLEKEYGTFGELGIDVAVDRNQKIWFIESNAKPAKDTILIAGPRRDIEQSFRLPFEYCKHLAGFQ